MFLIRKIQLRKKLILYLLFNALFIYIILWYVNVIYINHYNYNEAAYSNEHKNMKIVESKLNKKNKNEIDSNNLNISLVTSLETNELSENDKIKIFDLDVENDVIAFIRIQKTSGSNLHEKLFNFTVAKNQRTGVWENLCTYERKPKGFSCKTNKNGKALFWNRTETNKCDLHAGKLL